MPGSGESGAGCRALGLIMSRLSIHGGGAGGRACFEVVDPSGGGAAKGFTFLGVGVLETCFPGVKDVLGAKPSREGPLFG
jgi:hypothetical protein